MPARYEHPLRDSAAEAGEPGVVEWLDSVEESLLFMSVTTDYELEVGVLAK